MSVSLKRPRLSAVFVMVFALGLPLSLPFAHDAQAQSAKELYQQGDKLFLEKNYTKAASLFRKAAEQGNDDAQLALGFLYETGKGVKQDYEQAAVWYRKAIKQGNSGAKNNLHLLYMFERIAK